MFGGWILAGGRELKRKSIKSVWRKYVGDSGVVSYMAFLTWVKDILPELEKKKVVKVAKGKKLLIDVLDEEGLVRELHRKGYRF